MAGQIKVNYNVLEQMIADIDVLADQTEAHAKRKPAIRKSAGQHAVGLKGCVASVAEFARILALVMRDTAQGLREAEAEMMATDEQLAAQFASNGATAGALAASGGGDGASFSSGGGGGHSFGSNGH